MSKARFNFRPKLAPTGVVDVDILNAHTHSINHREDLFRSESCGCFDCLAIFPPEAIECWTDRVEDIDITALCPECGVDAVIGSVSGYPIEKWFLQKMHNRWFGDSEE